MRPLPSCVAACVLVCTAVTTSPGQTRPVLDSLLARAARDSLDPASHYHAGLGLLRARRYDDAETAFRRAVALDPRHAPARLGIAVVQDRNRDHWRALRRRGGDSAVTRERGERDAEYRRAFLLDPFADPAPLFYANRHGAPEDIPSELAAAYEALLNLEGLWFGHRNLPSSDSLPPGLLWLHGLVAAHTGHISHAIVDVNALLRVAQAHEQRDTIRTIPLRTNDFRYVLASLFVRMGDRTRAIILYREVLANDVGNFMANVRLAEVHAAGQEWSQAINARRAAVAANPDDPTLLVDLAGTLDDAGWHARAESILVDVGPTLPREPRLHYILGRARQAQSKNADARAAYETFLSLAPSRWTDEIADVRQRLAQLP